MNTRSRDKKQNNTEYNKDQIRQIFSQHIKNTKDNFRVEEDPNTSSNSSNSFHSSSSQIIASAPEIENLEINNNPSDSDKKNSFGNLNEKQSFREPENNKPTDKSSPKSKMPMTDEKIGELVEAIKLLADQVVTGKSNGQGNSKGLADVLGALDDGQFDKLNLKITERDAIKSHPWMAHCKVHDSKLQRIPTELSKLEDKTIKKAIYTYIRNKDEKLGIYEKMLLMTLESDPESNVSPSFLVRMINYLDEEKAANTITENKFSLKMSEIDRAINKEEMESFRRQLTQPNFSNSSKSTKPFSSWSKENKRIDKYLVWKQKYPNYKSMCLDWNITGNCKRGDNCGYKHECLRCHSNGEGPCEKQAKICEEQ